MNEGIFTQPGPDGIFGRGGTPQDATSPSIDSDDQNLRETLVAVFPSPGHMRVARATRNIKTNKVEKHEEFRIPTQKEVELLAQQGIRPTAMTPATLGAVGPAGGGGGLLDQPWLKLGVAAAVGAGALWAVNKWVLPRLEGSDDGDDEDEDDKKRIRDDRLRELADEDGEE